MPPPVAPTSLSIGKWMPAHRREFLASNALAARSSASDGNRKPRTVAAAGAGQRQQRDGLIEEQGTGRCHLLRAPDEGVAWGRQGRRLLYERRGRHGDLQLGNKITVGRSVAATDRPAEVMADSIYCAVSKTFVFATPQLGPQHTGNAARSAAHSGDKGTST